MLFAAGCSSDSSVPVSSPDVVNEDLAGGIKDRDDPGHMPEEDYPVPAECIAASIPSAPSTWASVERAPATWPEPPADSQLCLTSTTTDANIATFVASGSWADTMAHYEAALAGTELTWSSGEDTGTGYEQLAGTLDGSVFLVRESDAGFTLVFG